MGYHLFREVKRHAPVDLDTGELALLLILADEANDETRECFPGMDELCTYMRMSAVGVRKILQRLAQHGIDVRAPIGKDGSGRVIYAQKGARTTYRIPRFAPTGQTSEGDPVVPPKSTQRRSAGIANEGERGDGSIAIEAQGRSAGTPKAIPADRPSPHVPQEEDPHLLPPQRILRSAGITLGEEDEKRFIDWINRIDRKGTPWWRKVAANGDLPGLVADWRAEAAQEAPRPPNSLPPWCGQCGDGFGAARTNPRFRTNDGQPCTACHPDTAPRPAANGYQPYRNPTDPSVYDSWLQ